MSVLVFHDRDDPAATRRFDAWRHLNPHGFYASRKGNRWMLHRSWCRHMNTPGTARTAAAPKVCSLARPAVEDYVAQLGAPPAACKDCDPYASTPPSPPITGPSVELPVSLHGDVSVLAITPPAWEDPAFSASEGALRVRLVRDRYREGRLRDAKITEVLAASADGRLRCQVPGCGFDFEAVYGALGAGYAEVHHLRPLAEQDEARWTTLADLAVVCANCHAMIHRGGGCRPLEEILPHAGRHASG